MGSIIRPASLFFKVILITSLILVFSISFNVWWDLSLYEASIESLTEEKTKIISEFIEKNVIRSMERGRHFDTQRILQNFTIYRGIREIVLFTMDGTIRASTDENRLNRKIGNVDSYLKNKFFIREEKTYDEKRESKPVRVFYFNNPILNHPDCFQCHNKNDKVLGILTVASSLKEEDEKILKVKLHSIILGLVTIGFLSFILIFLFARFVERPISRMADVMGKVERGDFSARVNLRGKDEMGRLAQHLDSMIEKLKVAREEAEAYHQELVQRADRMATVGELASGIAHEIRNPLAGMHGAIQIIADGLPKEDGRRQVIDEIQKQIQRLEKLVKDLLNYAKPAQPKYLPMDLNEVIEKVLSFFLSHYEKSAKIKIEKNLSDSLPTLMADPGSMEQVFLNIILNAQKAMPQGGTLKVSSIYSNQEGNGRDEVRIVFEDTGIGIRKENLPKIFDPFFSTRSDGTGLGLSITRNIIEQHGGRIEVESEVNVGTKVIITLPAMKPA